MIQAKVEIFPLAHIFRISRGARTKAEVVTVTIEKNGVSGRGECVPYARYNETLESVIKQIESLPADINKDTLQDLVKLKNYNKLGAFMRKNIGINFYVTQCSNFRNFPENLE